ncbi:hypothetical protein [Nonomuraea jiangxiensis]|uniref:Uncharacterized protein n=1 Tax=Nonomuraea jiangxiensis TaxID=633440 RepID=A0A1G9IRI0_9ACTN|nr:hypothetical protein [Nonomuraea jiangxiensis]SDL27868.1 hypothetical protein SAMN05421869_12430 [Nonomuraea jiangxiensis]
MHVRRPRHRVIASLIGALLIGRPFALFRQMFRHAPSRAAVVIAAAFIVAGVFMVLYWDVRVLARRKIIPWYPVAPWA